MKCRSIKKYLYLKNSELTEEEKIILDKHLEECSSCRNERAGFYEYIEYVSQFGNLQPVNTDGNKLTDEIMEEIMQFRKWGNFFEIKNALLKYLSIPTVRYAQFAVLIFIIGFFLTEEISSASKIKSLEAAMNKRAIQTEAAGDDVLTGKDILKKVEGALELLAGNKRSIDLPAGWIALKRSDMINYITTFNELQILLEKYPDVDLTNYPLLKKINLNDGLDDKELDLILENRKELEKEMKDLITGRNKDENPNK